MRRMDLQRHYDRLVSVAAQPSTTVVQFAGKGWTRTRSLVCPWCGSVFYAYLPTDAEPALWPSGITEPEPEGGRGTRATCGHPLCWEAEDRHQWLRRAHAGGHPV